MGICCRDECSEEYEALQDENAKLRAEIELMRKDLIYVEDRWAELKSAFLPLEGLVESLRSAVRPPKGPFKFTPEELRDGFAWRQGWVKVDASQS